MDSGGVDIECHISGDGVESSVGRERICSLIVLEHVGHDWRAVVVPEPEVPVLYTLTKCWEDP